MNTGFGTETSPFSFSFLEIPVLTSENEAVFLRKRTSTMETSSSMKLLIPLLFLSSLRALAEAPEEEENLWHLEADFGPAFVQTWADYYQGDYRPDAALKGILLHPDPENRDLVVVFDAETLQLVTATDKGVSLDNPPFAGLHGTQNKVLNQETPFFNNASGPAWTNPAGSFDDTRKHPGHGNFEHMKFNGYYRHGHKIILDYDVNGTPILEEVVMDGENIRRILQVGAHEAPLRTRLSTTPAEESSESSGTISLSQGAEETTLMLDTPETDLIRIELVGVDYHPGGKIELVASELELLEEKTKGGPAIYPETFQVEVALDTGDGAYLVDQIPLPPQLEQSPYKNKVRITDFDFFADGDRAALCTWSGDVWLISGLNEFKTITWKRFAAGMFEPLGLKIVDDVIHLNCRDGIWQVIDLNNDNEADHYKVFNYDVIITDNFHEFSFGLETDPEGNFYFAKASPVANGGRNFDKILDHNGTFMKLTPDGKSLSVVATGLRAPGGIGVGPKGELTTGENEGSWQPCCKINYFTKEQRPVFLGTEQARQGITKDFHPPLCYLPMTIDNSGGGQVWVPENAKIGIPPGELLHLSYGQSAVYHVLPQQLENGLMQGGVIKLPIKLSSSAQRAAFHKDGSLFISGMRGWQSNAAAEAGIQRVRYNEGVLAGLPEAMSVSGDKLILRFDSKLDEELATDPESFAIKRWKYIRGPQYGSGQFSIDTPDETAEQIAQVHESKSHKKHDPVEVTSAELGEDGKTITLTIPTLKPAQQMEIAYDLESTDGEVLIGTIYSTIHQN